MSLGSSTSSVPTRNAGDELSNFFGNSQNYQGLLNYQSQSANAATGSQQNAAQAALGLYPSMSNAQNAGTSSARSSTLGDLQSLGGGYVNSLTGSTPLLGASQNQLTNMVNSAGQQNGLTQSLNSNALSNLNLGTGLSAEQARDATQAADQGLASRGMAMGNNAIGTEVLSRDSYGQQLQSQRQAQALNVANLNNTQQNTAQNLVLGANSAGQTLANSALGLMGNTTGVNVNGATNFISPTASVGASTAGTSSLMGYLNDVNSSNQNALISAQNSQNNLYGALGGASLGALGTLGGSYIKWG